MKVAIFSTTGSPIAMFSQPLTDLLLTLASQPLWAGLPLRVLDGTSLEYVMVLDAIPPLGQFDVENPGAIQHFVDTLSV